MHENSLPTGDRDDVSDWSGRWTPEDIAKDILLWNENSNATEKIDLHNPQHPEMEPEQVDEVRRILLMTLEQEDYPQLPEIDELRSKEREYAALMETQPIISQKAIWQNSENHGWHNPPATLPEDLLLIHSEISEACEAYRKGNLRLFTTSGDANFDGSVEEELADAVIRIFHVAEKNGMNICEAVRLKHEWNIKRPYRHGNKKI